MTEIQKQMQEAYNSSPAKVWHDQVKKLGGDKKATVHVIERLRILANKIESGEWYGVMYFQEGSDENNPITKKLEIIVSQPWPG